MPASAPYEHMRLYTHAGVRRSSHCRAPDPIPLLFLPSFSSLPPSSALLILLYSTCCVLIGWQPCLQ